MENTPVLSDNELRRQAIEGELAAIRKSSEQIRSLLEINEARTNTILELLGDMDQQRSTEVALQIATEAAAVIPEHVRFTGFKPIGEEIYADDKLWYQVECFKNDAEIPWLRYLETFFSPLVTVGPGKDDYSFHGRGYLVPFKEASTRQTALRWMHDGLSKLERSTFVLAKLAAECETGFYYYGGWLSDFKAERVPVKILFILNTPTALVAFDLSRTGWPDPVVFLRSNVVSSYDLKTLTSELVDLALGCC